MDYRETAPAAALADFVKAFWSLDIGKGAGDRAEHRATPDGCVEIVHRLRGCSMWMREQPAFFLVGLTDRPAILEFSGDARFQGVRLWPWTLSLICGANSTRLRNDWAELDPMLLQGCMPKTEGEFEAAIGGALALRPEAPEVGAIGRLVLQSASVAHLVGLSGRSARWLQRWFARYVGMPPRTYFRLLRFQEALVSLQSSSDVLAAHAAEHGYADQAHMAKEFRALVGRPAGLLRRKARGPFI